MRVASGLDSLVLGEPQIPAVKKPSPTPAAAILTSASWSGCSEIVFSG